MKSFKKLLAVMLLLVVAVIPAVANGGSDKAVEAEVEEFSIIPEETLELTVFSQLANYSGEQIGWFGQVMLEKFNVKLNIVSDPDKSIFATRMASGDLGDIVVFGNDGDEYKQAYDAGLLWDWDDENLLDEYGSYIKETFPFALEKNRTLSGGTLYGFGHNVAGSGKDHQAFFYHPDIRWDLYKELGYPEVNTLEDYIPVLEAMVKNNPTSDTGSKTYGVSLFPDWDGDMVTFVKSTGALYGYDEFGFGLYDTNTNTYQHLFAEDSFYLRSLKFYNTLFQKGLLDPDSMTQNYDLHIEKFQKGAAFFVIFNWMGSGTYNSEDHLNAGKAMLPLVAKDAKTLTYGLNVYGSNRIWTIGAKTQYPELCMTILNWLSTPEGRLTREYGPRGACWDYDADGYAYLTPTGLSAADDPNGTELTGGYSGTWSDGDFKINNETWDLNAVNPEGNGETFNFEKWKNTKSGAVSAIEQDWRDQVGYDDYDEYIESFNYSVAPGTTFSMAPRTDELNTTWQQVAEAIKTYTWQAIYAETDAEFDKLVVEMEEKAMAYGYEECKAFVEEQAAIRAALCKEVLSQ